MVESIKVKVIIFLCFFLTGVSRGAVIKIFIAGDVMTGRGVDQILPFPVDPKIYERYVTDSRDYVKLAESTNGQIPRKVSKDYIWGDALKEWEKRKPDLKIVNLETSITKNNEYMKGKGINYRMNPQNISHLTYLDIVTLSNNHVLDYEKKGLLETISTLQSAKIKFAGAGENISLAQAPAMGKINKNRVLVFSMGLSSSGIPNSWKASKDNPGVYLLDNLSEKTLEEVKSNIKNYQKPGDLIIVSIHWGSNWGYEVTTSQQKFARGLIDFGVDLIHGHSSHHPRPIEIYKGKPIIYGSGDFINDYEGISGHENYRGDLSLMYFLEFDSNKLASFQLVPMQIKNFRLHYAGEDDKKWMLETLKKISTSFGIKYEIKENFIFATSK